MDPRENLRQWLVDNLLEDDTDLMHYAQFAGRLASLGDTSGIEAFAKIAQRPAFAGRLEAILEERCQRGLWDLDQQLGRDLAHCVIEAQDFWCFRRYAKVLVPPRIAALIEEWATKASDVELDDEAVDLLERFLITYPIAEEDQLPTVSAPMTQEQYEMLDRVLLSIKPREIKKTWVSPNAAADNEPEEMPTESPSQDEEDVQEEDPLMDDVSSQYEEFLYEEDTQENEPLMDGVSAYCGPDDPFSMASDFDDDIEYYADDDHPSPRTMKEYDSVCDIQTPNGSVRVARQINEKWELQIIVPETFPAIDSLRVGSIPLTRDKDEPEFWVLPLKYFGRANRERLLDLPVVIRPADANCLIKISNR